jgi:hypothetical protein
VALRSIGLYIGLFSFRDGLYFRVYISFIEL